MKRYFIYWNTKQTPNGQLTACEVHYTVGYNTATLKDYNDMTAELRKMIPQVTEDRIEVGITRGSGTMDGHTIIVWNGYLARGEYPEFRQVVDKDPDYKWRAQF